LQPARRTQSANPMINKIRQFFIMIVPYP
jgi:hypothetical protein